MLNKTDNLNLMISLTKNLHLCKRMMDIKKSIGVKKEVKKILNSKKLLNQDFLKSVLVAAEKYIFYHKKPFFLTSEYNQVVSIRAVTSVILLDNEIEKIIRNRQIMSSVGDT